MDQFYPSAQETGSTRRRLRVEIKLLAATYDEVAEMVRVEKQAFKNDPIYDLCFNGSDEMRQNDDTQVNKHLDRMANPRFVYHKAVDADDPDGGMIGVSWWYLSPDPHSETVNSPFGEFGPNAHMDCLQASLAPLRRWRYEYFRDLGVAYAHMAMLSVISSRQRQGVGTALLREGLKEVDRRALPTYISASPAGLGLYQRFGWEARFGIKVNLADYGGEDLDVATVAMIRPAPPRPRTSAS